MTDLYELTSEVDAPSVVIVALPAITDPVNEFGPERHCTLAYLGTMHEGHEFLLGSLQNALAEIASQVAPFEASVSGSGHIGDDQVAVLILESEELTALQEAITCTPTVAMLTAMSADDQYPTWIPHLTIGEEHMDLDTTELPEEISFNAIALWAGEQQFTFMLNAPGPVDIFDVDTGNIVDMNVVMAAGLKGFTESLHPRGADGRFIPKFGIVKWLKNGHWQYGKVEGINKSGDGKDIDITATPSDLGGKLTGEPSVVLKPNQVYRAPVKVAHLPLGVSAGKDPKPDSPIKKVSGQAGSNPGGMYLIPQEAGADGKKYYVKHAKSDEKGRNEELANTLYADAGVAVPEVDYNPADGNIYSPVTEGKHDMDTRITKGDKEWMDQVRKNFVVDAWLGNWDVFGLNADNIKTDENGTPWRIDNGGALLYRAQGAPKGSDFGSKVPELESLRTSPQGKKVYGKGLTKAQELDGAERVLAITPGQIEDRVAEAGMPKSLADTLKARRKYIADYYGLALPESVKPADTDQMSTSAPLVDPADLSVSKGKSRRWFPMTMAEVGFIAQTGDKLALPDNSQVTIGQDEDGNLLSNVARQTQILGLAQTWGGQDVMLTKGSDLARPTHDANLTPLELSAYKWQRGDRLESDGTQLAVLGMNTSSGAMLVQSVVPEGSTAPPPFLLDTWATKPTHKSFTVKRWDPAKTVAPAAPKETVAPPSQSTMSLSDTSDAVDLADMLEPELPAVPEGQAVEISKKVKEDLIVPLPTGDGAPAKAKTTAVPGEKSMVLSDGTIAKPGSTVISKFGGEYKFVKPKGPYAVVTDPNGDDPEKLLTKKASTLFQLPGAEKAEVGELPKPKLASGGVPVVGMIAKAKDGHEGEITMISPDGKFVFITNAAGVKKRKSVGTVSAVSGPSAPKTEPKPPEDTTPELEEWEKELLAAPAISLSEYGEYKQLKDIPALKPGDKVSQDGTSDSWWTVDYVGGMTVDLVHEPTGEITNWSKDSLQTFMVTPAAQIKVPEKPVLPPTEEIDLGIPGNYSPPADQTVVKITNQVNPLDTEFYANNGDGTWSLIDWGGPNPQFTATDAEVMNYEGWSSEVIHGPNPPTPAPASKPVSANLSLNQPMMFNSLEPGDTILLSNNVKATVVGYPMTVAGGDGVLAMADEDGNVFPLYMSGFQPTEKHNVTTGLTYTADPQLNDAINNLYDNAWHTPDLDNVQGVNGNVALSYMAIQQGLDPNADKWLAFDTPTETFWDLTNAEGSGIALKWDPDTKEWAPDPAKLVPIQSKQPDIQNQIEPDPVAVETYAWTAHSGTEYLWTKGDNGLWTLPNNDDAYTDEEMAQYFEWTPDKVEMEPYVAPGNVGGDPDVSFQGYHPGAGDKVISLTNADATVETWWVQKQDSNIWKGILENGQLNDAHPMPNKDIDNILTLDGWSKTEHHGFDSTPDNEPDNEPDDVVINTSDWPGSYTADDDETIIKTEHGTWLTSSDGGQVWHEIDDESGTTINVPWHQADLDGISYDTFQQGNNPEPEPSTAELAEPIGQPLAPPPAIDLTALKQLPEGYGLKNGKHVRVASFANTGGATTYWESVSDKASFWRQIMPDGSLGAQKVGTSKLPGWGSTEIFNGNHQLVKDTEDGKITPAGMPLSMVPYEPVDITTLPSEVQAYIIDNPGTGTLEIARKDGSQPKMYYLVKPDGSVAEYKEKNGTVNVLSASSKDLIPAWDAKVKNGTAEKLTFKDVSPNSVVPQEIQEAAPAALPEPPASELSPPPVKIPGTSDHPATPNGYVLTPGQQVKHVEYEDVGSYWYVQNGPDNWSQVNPGGYLNSFTYTDEELNPENPDNSGNKIDTYQVPGQIDDAPVDKSTAPTDLTVPVSMFGGYQAVPGDTVVSIVQTSGAEPAFWVKPAGGEQWNKITNGQIDPLQAFDDDTIEWALDPTTGLAGTTVYGTFSPTPASVTPPVVTDPGALPKTMIDVNQYTLEDGGVVPQSTGTELADIGGVPEGFSVYVYPYLDGTGVAGSYNPNYGETYLVNNAGVAYYLDGSGKMAKASLPGDAKKLKIKAPSSSPVKVNQAPQVSNWAEEGMPDPATLPFLTDDAVLTVPPEGAWALQETSTGTKVWVHMKPGTYDMSKGEVAGVDQYSIVDDNGSTGAPISYGGTIFKIGTQDGNLTAWVDPKVLEQAGAPATTAPVSTPSATVTSIKPAWPGEKKPSPEDIASWGGLLTKDGHIPTVGMYVKRGSMTGKIMSVNHAKNKATVLTSDGKMSLRQIDLLTVDAQQNYQAYAPKSAPVDLPEGMPLAIETIQEALDKTIKDGTFRGLLPGQDGIRNGEMFVSSVKTPSGKKVNRVSFALTKEYRATLINMLSGKGEPVEKGDWDNKGKDSQAVAVGDLMSMRISSIKMPDGTDQWKPDPQTKPPTHKVVNVGKPDASDGGKFAVTMEPVDGGDQIVAYFLPNKSISVYTWDPNKPKPKPAAGSLTLSAAATAQGWKLTNPSSDGIISAVQGGAHDGTLDVEPGKVVPISSSAFHGGGTGSEGYQPGGLRLVDPNGVIIEISSMDTKNHSYKGNVVITLPASAKAEQLNAALDKMGLAHKPLTQAKAKENVLPLLRSMLDFDKSDIDTAKSYSAEQLFAKMGTAAGINDIGWHDVLVGVDEGTGKTSYFWSDRVREAYNKKSPLKLALRASDDGSVDSIIGHVLYGTANGVTKRTTGMIHTPSGKGTGHQAYMDASNNGGHGGFFSASESGVFHSSNQQAGYVSAQMMVFTRPENIWGRIMDFRAHKSSDAFGNPGTGANNVTTTMKGGNVKDFQLNGGLPAGATGLIAVTNNSYRKTAIEKLKSMGITQVNGIPLEEYVVLKTSLGSKSVKDLPPFYLPPNARPIMDLPVSYGMAAAA